MSTATADKMSKTLDDIITEKKSQRKTVSLKSKRPGARAALERRAPLKQKF